MTLRDELQRLSPEFAERIAASVTEKMASHHDTNAEDFARDFFTMLDRYPAVKAMYVEIGAIATTQYTGEELLLFADGLSAATAVLLELAEIDAMPSL